MNNYSQLKFADIEFVNNSNEHYAGLNGFSIDKEYKNYVIDKKFIISYNDQQQLIEEVNTNSLSEKFKSKLVKAKFLTSDETFLCAIVQLNNELYKIYKIVNYSEIYEFLGKRIIVLFPIVENNMNINKNNKSNNMSMLEDLITNYFTDLHNELSQMRNEDNNSEKTQSNKQVKTDFDKNKVNNKVRMIYRNESGHESFYLKYGDDEVHMSTYSDQSVLPVYYINGTKVDKKTFIRAKEIYSNSEMTIYEKILTIFDECLYNFQLTNKEPEKPISENLKNTVKSVENKSNHCFPQIEHTNLLDTDKKYHIEKFVIYDGRNSEPIHIVEVKIDIINNTTNYYLDGYEISEQMFFDLRNVIIDIMPITTDYTRCLHEMENHFKTLLNSINDIINELPVDEDNLVDEDDNCESFDDNNENADDEDNNEHNNVLDNLYHDMAQYLYDNRDKLNNVLERYGTTAKQISHIFNTILNKFDDKNNTPF